VRVTLQPAYLLHQQPYRDHSALVEVWTRDYGRLGLMARGVQRPKSPMRGLLQPFRPLLLSWSGRGDLPTLTGVEPNGLFHWLEGSVLLSGLYLNELLLRLTPREESHSQLFEDYGLAVSELAQVPRLEEAARAGAEQSLLRRFELHLLAELGYGLLLDREAESGAPLADDALYVYDFDRGPVRLATRAPLGEAVMLRGHSLLALAQAGDLTEPQVLRDAKLLLRAAIDHHMSGRALQSRRLRHAYERLRIRPAADSPSRSADPVTPINQVEP